MSKWQIEQIPNTDRVFRNLNPRNVQEGIIMPHAFTDHKGKPSVNWEKYCSNPVDSPKRMNPDPKAYSRFGVCALNVGMIRKIASQDAIHEPTDINRAHSAIIGEKTERVLNALCDIAEIVVDIPGNS